MPNYIDLFGIQLEKKKDRFQSFLTEGVELKNLKEEYEEQFKKYYIPIDNKLLDENYEAIAIDASGGKREFFNGIYFYINRAHGVVNNGDHLRDLETDVFSINGPATMAETYLGWKSENLEIKILKGYLNNKNQEDNNLKICFIDGSLYSRVMHPIVESTVKDDEDYILKYLDFYLDTLSEAKRKNVVLIGLSKDSRALFFRNSLLDEIFYKEREIIKDKLDSSQINVINSVIKGIDNPNERDLKIFEKLIKEKPKLLKKIAQIYHEYNLSRTDGEIIYRFSKFPGFTHPMEMGLGRSHQKILFNQIKRDPTSLIRNRFKNKILDLNIDDRKDFFNYALNVLNKLLKIPTFISFHILIDIRDNPIKVDIPSWYFESFNTLSDYPFVAFINKFEPLLKKLINFIIKLYGGTGNYNLLLSAAHDNVVLRLSSFNEIYEKLLEDKLGIILPFKRRTKRYLFG